MTRLTKAEREAIDAISRYPSVKAAAHALRKSPWTVKEQLASARQRVGVETNAQLVRATFGPDTPVSEG